MPKQFILRFVDYAFNVRHAEIEFLRKLIVCQAVQQAPFQYLSVFINEDILVNEVIPFVPAKVYRVSQFQGIVPPCLPCRQTLSRGELHR